jgi:uncharacterized repeat protein (TIGR03806 family)
MVACGLAVACGGTPEPSQSGPRAACAGLPRLELEEAVAFEAVFGGVRVDEGVALARIPGTGERWAIVSKPGVVFTFEAGEGEPRPWIDIRDRVEAAPEAGLLGIAIHPRFEDDAEVFLSYTTPGGERFLSRVSSFRSVDGGATLDPATESVVLEIDQPFSNHDGGDIHFGPDGHLYAAWGDGGAHSDPRGHGQNVDTLLGSIVRLDVDGGDPYAIPEGNPFAAGGGRPEIFAWGFRNPWRFSFDRDTGELWAGDVGQNLWEEVDLVVRGGNYGWSAKEGDGCFGRDTCDVPDAIDPVATYRNSGAASVIGGYVYRGSRLPDLFGAYVYSDYYLGTVWAVRPGEVPVVLHRSGGRRVAAWAEDEAGELYGVVFDGGIVRMVPPEPARDDGFPRRLSESACVDMADPRVAAAGTVAYDVALPFWSDGADKVRALAVPDGARIEVLPDGDLDLPPGSVLVKSFFEPGSAAGVPIETRLLVRHDDGEWAGYAYAWRDDGTEADLVPDGLVRTIADVPWSIPAVQDCDFCHTRAAGGSLGLELRQLAIDHEGRDQLELFVERGWLDARPAADPLPSVSSEAPLPDRARAYLHVNCSSCHREDGPQGRAALDLRSDVALVETGLCSAPSAGEADLVDPRIVAPGDPEGSVLLARVRSLGSVRMPPLGSGRVDDEGAMLLTEWIAAMTGCP